MKARKLLTRLTKLPLWAQAIGAVVVAVLCVWLFTRFAVGIHAAIFGNTEAKREHANVQVAHEQTKAVTQIAAQQVKVVHDKEVFHDRVTQIVHDNQEKVDVVAQPTDQMDPQIDAAIAAGLCQLHHDLCRQPAPAEVQPVR